MRANPIVPSGPPSLRGTLRRILLLLAKGPAPRPLLERDAEMSKASAHNYLRELSELRYARCEIVEGIYVWFITEAGTQALAEGSTRCSA